MVHIVLQWICCDAVCTADLLPHDLQEVCHLVLEVCPGSDGTLGGLSERVSSLDGREREREKSARKMFDVKATQNTGLWDASGVRQTKQTIIVEDFCFPSLTSGNISLRASMSEL